MLVLTIGPWDALLLNYYYELVIVALTTVIVQNPIFPGESDIDQISKICHVLGTPTEEQWPLMKSFSDYIELM